MRRKNFLSTIFVGLLMIFLIVPSVSNAANGTAELIIFHTNDMHSRILSTDDNGKSIGLAEMAAAVKAVKKKNPDTLWLDAGDMIHGMPNINVSRGENIIPFLNEAGLDALTPGNHDFNYGSDRLEQLVKKMKFPLLSVNTVRRNNHNEKLFKPYKIFNLANGITVGVIGVTTPEVAYKTAPTNVTTVDFLNPVETAKIYIEELRPKCDVLIGLMHMGVDPSSEFTSERIAKEAPGFDLIVDGHSHTTLPDGLTVGDTLIVQTGWHEYRLGRVKILLRDHKITAKQAQLLTAADVKKIAPKPDEKIAKDIRKMEKRNAKIFNQVVAHSDKHLTSNPNILRRSESEFGNLCADMMRWKTGADIGVINGGGMREDLPQGAVTRGDTIAVFPFGNTIKKAEINGKTIREMLERSVYGYPGLFGGFLDVSGMTFSFDPTKPIGQRVEEIFVNGAPLDENKIYTIGATDFAFAGGDGYDMLKGLKIIGEFGSCENALEEYLDEVGTKGIELGRIKNLHELPLPEETLEEKQAA